MLLSVKCVTGLDQAVHKQVSYFNGDTLFDALPKSYRNTVEHPVTRRKVRRVEPASEMVFW